MEDYNKKLEQERKELYKARKRYEAEMLAERERVIALLEGRGIHKAKRRFPGDEFDRVITVDNYRYSGLIESTCFQIPEDIDLRKVVSWFVHSTKYGECTVFLLGWNPTTVRCDRDIEYFFKYAPEARERYLAKVRAEK